MKRLKYTRYIYADSLTMGSGILKIFNGPQSLSEAIHVMLHIN